MSLSLQQVSRKPISSCVRAKSAGSLFPHLVLGACADDSLQNMPKRRILAWVVLLPSV